MVRLNRHGWNGRTNILRRKGRWSWGRRFGWLRTGIVFRQSHTEIADGIYGYFNPVFSKKRHYIRIGRTAFSHRQD